MIDWRTSWLLRELAEDMERSTPRDWATAFAAAGLMLLAVRACCLLVAALAGVMGL